MKINNGISLVNSSHVKIDWQEYINEFLSSPLVHHTSIGSATKNYGPNIRETTKFG